MSEITVTLSKKRYDEMLYEIDTLKKQLDYLNTSIDRKRYFYQEFGNDSYKVYYKPLEHDEIVESYEAKYIELQEKWKKKISEQNDLISEKNGVILELNRRIREYEQLEKTPFPVAIETPTAPHPTVMETHTTTLYIPKKKKRWWKIS